MILLILIIRAIKAVCANPAGATTLVYRRGRLRTRADNFTSIEYIDSINQYCHSKAREWVCMAYKPLVIIIIKDIIKQHDTPSQAWFFHESCPGRHKRKRFSNVSTMKFWLKLLKGQIRRLTRLLQSMLERL